MTHTQETLMERMNPRQLRARNSGQTLIIAILILGVLLILGAAFASLLAQSIREASTATRRSQAGSLAESGIRMAHSQLLESPLGADWRPDPVDLGAGPQTVDPDALFLRPGTGLTIAPNASAPARTVVDLGGPDFLGAYSRMTTENGRVLVRVRYAPSDFDAFAADSSDAFRQVGAAGRYILIEAVGRSRSLDSGTRTDPTLALDEAVRINGFADAADLAREIGRMRQLDREQGETEKLVAIASIGMLETARFITDKDRRRSPAEIGFPSGSGELLASGAMGSGPGVGAAEQTDFASAVGITAPSVNLGLSLPSGSPGSSSNWSRIPGFGSLYSNAPLKVYGNISASLNRTIGEAWRVAGDVEHGEPGAGLSLLGHSYDRATDTWTQDAPFVFPSGPTSTTNRSGIVTRGLLVDGRQEPDAQGVPRGTPRKEAPSLFTSASGRPSRYVSLTRDSGDEVGGVNRGQHGFGEGVYVDSAERGNRSPQDWRLGSTPLTSLPKDWLTPNNPSSSAWQGPYYIPIAAQLRLNPGGFEIIRDSRSRSSQWFGSNSSTLGIRLRTIAGQTFSINSIEHAALYSLADGSITDSDFQTIGRPFNGVIYFEGDVRVRGAIPADVQISVVSGGTIYIDGSITRTTGPNNSGLRTRSAIGLMARDHVALNATMFAGPAPGQQIQVKTTDLLPNTPNPVEVNFTGGGSELNLETEFVLDPESGAPGQVDTWTPTVLGSTDLNGRRIPPQLLLLASAEDSGPAYASIFVQPSTGSTAAGGQFQFGAAFDLDLTGGLLAEAYNAASVFYPEDPNLARDPLLPLYGLGDASINAYPRFEQVAMPFLGAGSYSSVSRVMTDTTTGVQYPVGSSTIFNVRPAVAGGSPPKSLLIARSAIQAHDVRVEAMIYAEEGSFYVIPGPSFNPNPEDTRFRFERSLQAPLNLTREQANRERYRQFGSSPMAPFYDEPLHVRVQILGSITENRPAPMSDQAIWLKRWGWMPAEIGSSGLVAGTTILPNLELRHDPVLATGSFDGSTPVRQDGAGRPLPPLPRLPVSPTLLFFGEVKS